MTHLQHLSANHVHLNLAALVAINSSSLTKLEILSRSYAEPEYDTMPACIPAGHPLPGLEQLQALRLDQCCFDASVLAYMPQLQELVLQHCILYLKEESSDDYYDFDEGADQEGHLNPEESLLTAVAQLQHLRHLELCRTYIPRPRTSDLTLYAGLSASSHLTKLEIIGDKEPPWALGGAQYVFPAGRQLQHLREVHLEKCIGAWGSLHAALRDRLHCVC
jgi:hypothetical protein